MQIFRIISTILISAALILPLEAVAASKPVAISNLATQYKLTAISQTSTNIRWKTDKSEITFSTGSRRMTFDKRIFWLNGPIVKNGKKWSISQTDARTVLKPLLKTEMFLRKQGNSMVILDPGHGGKDPGGIGGSTREKTLVLDIARRVRSKLNRAHITVGMTRTHDTFLELADRPKLASHRGADIFVSIHANKAARKGACGIETYIMPAEGFCSTTSTKADCKKYPGNNNNAANTILANYIHRELLDRTHATDRGIKRARFTVIKYADCPAVLVEVGFLTNPAEAKKLITPDYREKIAEGIARGIMTYIEQIENCLSKQQPVRI
jgi:N-acetylmuramoyl-L-alanine amidase